MDKITKKQKTREEFLKIMKEKANRFERAKNDDADSIMKCMCERKMISKKDLNEYYQTKKKYRD